MIGYPVPRVVSDQATPPVSERFVIFAIALAAYGIGFWFADTIGDRWPLYALVPLGVAVALVLCGRQLDWLPVWAMTGAIVVLTAGAAGVFAGAVVSFGGEAS